MFVVCLFSILPYIPTVLELPKGNLIVYRQSKNLHNCNCAIYYETCILSGELCLNKHEEAFLFLSDLCWLNFKFSGITVGKNDTLNEK